ncbi:MAG: DUF1995 family protein [Synechococcales cyanobacterium RM1_1_8]|nr:DUF1995 family protein [Synechococcales cyanobacterium RM1_1_8]
MIQLPNDAAEAAAQSLDAAQSALTAGLTRIQVELKIPELKVQPIAKDFIAGFADYGDRLRVFFPDAGAAALARRDWGETAFAIRGINDVKADIQEQEELFIFVEPSAVEVREVEKLCEQAGDRPVIFLNPALEDVATIGIGYAGRQLRDRFLSQIESCYYIRPLDAAALFRCYPDDWQLWLEKGDSYEKIADFSERPSGEAIDNIFLSLNSGDASPGDGSPRPAKAGFLTNLQRFFNALSQ